MKRAVVDIATAPAVFGEMNTSASGCAPDTPRVICIAFIVTEDFTALSAGAIVALDEQDLLRSFRDEMNRPSVKALVSRADLSLLQARSAVHHIDLPAGLNPQPSAGPAKLRRREAAALQARNEAIQSHWEWGRQREIAQICLDDCWAHYKSFCSANSMKATPRSFVEESLEVDLGVRRSRGGTPPEPSPEH